MLNFWKNVSGAVIVDWFMLTAAVLGLGLIVINADNESDPSPAPAVQN